MKFKVSLSGEFVEPRDVLDIREDLSVEITNEYDDINDALDDLKDRLESHIRFFAGTEPSTLTFEIDTAGGTHETISITSSDN